MARWLAHACVVLALCFGGSAWAKPKIAILGLEAAPGTGGTVDPATTQVARAITKELRQRARAVASPYTIAPNSNKELTDEKLLMSCDSEAASCMAVIGAGLAADVVMYGRVEKKGEVYRVSLKRLDVQAKTIETRSEELPVGSSVVGMAKRLYFGLVGQSSMVGALTVKAVSQTGAVIANGNVTIDDQARGPLVAGRLTVNNLAEGRHVLGVEARGYRRFEETVTIRAGEPATINALLLIRDAAREPAPDRSGLWRASFITSVAVAALGGAFAGYSFYQQESGDPEPHPEVEGQIVPQLTNNECSLSVAEIKEQKHIIVGNEAEFRRKCDWHPRIFYGFGVAGIGVVGALVSFVMLSRESGSSEPLRTGERSAQRRVAVTPIVTPSLTGASLSVTW